MENSIVPSPQEPSYNQTVCASDDHDDLAVEVSTSSLKFLSSFDLILPHNREDILLSSSASYENIRTLNVLGKGSEQNCIGSSEMHNSGIICENPEILSEFSIPLRPESLSLPNICHNDEQEQRKSNSDEQLLQKNMKEVFSGVIKNQPIDVPEQKGISEVIPCSHLSSSLPHGTITRKGDMIQFVADNLQEKIKLSSPVSYVDNDSSSSRRSSVHSFSSSTSFATSSGMSRSPSSQFRQSPDDIPPIDATAVIELENHARKVADNLDLMMGNIRNNLHKMSAITIGCQDAYKRSVDITCDSVDSSIKAMYALMAKCEELTAVIGPVELLALQIKEIKRILDLFEVQLCEK